MEKEKVSLSIGNKLVFHQDSPVNVNLSELNEIFKKDRINVNVNLGAGDKSYFLYTSDLSYDYVKINADYRS